MATESDQKPIEQVRAGERVWACDLTVDEWRLCRVAETYLGDYVGDLAEVFVGGERIESTYHHPYWVIEGEDLDDRPKPDHVAAAEVNNAIVPGRWVDACDLRVGDVLLLMDGRRLPVEEIILRQVEERVYNFQVEGLHNYAVGPSSVLVHNNGKCPVSVPRPRGRAPEFFGGRTSESGFLNAAEDYLRAGYREVSPGRYVSADGMRQVRFGAHETRRPRLHGHFEAFDSPYGRGGRIIENTIVDIFPD